MNTIFKRTFDSQIWRRGSTSSIWPTSASSGSWRSSVYLDELEHLLLLRPIFLFTYFSLNTGHFWGIIPWIILISNHFTIFFNYFSRLYMNFSYNSIISTKKNQFAMDFSIKFFFTYILLYLCILNVFFSTRELH